MRNVPFWTSPTKIGTECVIPSILGFLRNAYTSQIRPHRFPDSKLFMRNQVLFPRTKYQRTFFVWADDPVGVVELFDSTIMWCSQYKEPGVYHMDTMFYFISRNRTTTEVLFAQNNVQKHNNVASIERLGEDAFAFFGYNFYHSEQGDARREKLNFVWKKGQPPEKICQLFTSVGEFHGKKMTIGILPWFELKISCNSIQSLTHYVFYSQTGPHW